MPDDLLDRAGPQPPRRRARLDDGLTHADMVYFNKRILNRIRFDAKKNFRSFSAEIHLILLAHFYGEGAKAEALASPVPKGARIDKDWKPSVQDMEWAREKYGLTRAECDDITAEFIDYWIALSGKRALKSNWSSTWRNRVRRQFARRVRDAGPRSARGPDAPRGPGNRSFVAAAGRVLDREQARANGRAR